MSPSGRADRLRGRLSINPDESAPPAAVQAAPESPPTPPAAEPVEGAMYYRSFYVPDDVFARYRAAIYWSARNPRAIGEVPENMSQDVTAHMERVADELERRFNDGDQFPEAPAPRRRRKRGKTGQ